MESKWNFLRKKFGHQLVAAKITESNTAANTHWAWDLTSLC
jgi:hypothetical protein